MPWPDTNLIHYCFSHCFCPFLFLLDSHYARCTFIVAPWPRTSALVFISRFPVSFSVWSFLLMYLRAQLLPSAVSRLLISSSEALFDQSYYPRASLCLTQAVMIKKYIKFRHQSSLWSTLSKRQVAFRVQTNNCGSHTEESILLENILYKKIN